MASDGILEARYKGDTPGEVRTLEQETELAMHTHGLHDIRVTFGHSHTTSSGQLQSYL
jgi:hypothetical protein